MSKIERQELIREIERIRGTRVLVYVTGDRSPVAANIGDDAVRPIIQHLRAMGAVDALDVFIYSRGGAIDVPWRLNSAFRHTAGSWDALVPFRANSAATLLCLGANAIVLGPQGELGPIDPIMSFSGQGPSGPIQHDVSVEDIMAFPKFAADRFGLKDETSNSAALNKLVDRLDAVMLGSAYRTHSHIRYLAEQMLRSRGDGMTDETIAAIVKTLAEDVFAHGHAVGMQEAKRIGLPVESPSAELDAAMWTLLEAYEVDLKLLQPIDTFAAVQGQELSQEEVTTGAIDSTGLSHEFRGALRVSAQRQMPQTLTVNLNMPVQLPPGFDPTQLPTELSQMLQQLQNSLLNVAQDSVREALQAQAALTGLDVRLVDAAWREV